MPSKASRSAAKSKDAQYEAARQEQLQALSHIIAANTQPSTKAKIEWSVRAALTLTLAAISSSVSQLVLSPVYGSIPSSVYHTQLVTATFLCAWALRAPFRWMNWTGAMPILLPAIAFWIPPVQYLLFQQSNALGPIVGPVVTEILTLLPGLILSISITASAVDLVQIQGPEMLATAAHSGLGAVAYVIFNSLESLSLSWIVRNLGANAAMSRIGLQTLLAMAYAILSPSRILLFCIPALLHTLILNPHNPSMYTTSILDKALQSRSTFTVLARHESFTGYISVVENSLDKFRILRCDHSILGGEWLQPPAGLEHTSNVREPVYAIFTMLEAVRLVDRGTSNEDTEENALIIGLGIGTSASALIAHGIAVTTIEIDPIIHRYATDYFHLPSNHTSIINNAITYVSSATTRPSEKYTYIIHDVFTGGAEPAALFTVEFLSGLRTLLKPNGVIVINYAGDITSSSTRLIVRTILRTFQYRCRLFRESGDDPKKQASQDDSREIDFTNLAIFCKPFSSSSDSAESADSTTIITSQSSTQDPPPPQSPEESRTTTEKHIRFRQPVEADFLNSYARKAFMVPDPRLELSSESFLEPKENDDDDDDDDNHDNVLYQAGVAKFEAHPHHVRGAVGHWRLMRTVLPPVVWELW